MYMPAWLLATPLPGFWKRKQKMKTQQRLDPAQVAAAFQADLIRLIDVARSDGAWLYALDDVLESQLTRLRMAAANKPR
jgi:hypothetical protein